MDEAGFISIRGATGVENVPVRVVGRVKDRFRCRLERDARLPGKAWGLRGEFVLVPKGAVTFAHPQPEQLDLLKE